MSCLDAPTELWQRPMWPQYQGKSSANRSIVWSISDYAHVLV